MEKPKPKELSTKQSSSQNTLTKTSLEDSGGAVLQEVWGEQLAALSDRTFTSVEDACQAVIECVIERMDSKGADQEQLRAFLTEAFASDPDLIQEIRETLKVNS